jgi:hypothetical protein
VIAPANKPWTWRDKLEHVGIALAIQVALWLASGDAWLGAAAAIGLFYGREERDAENRGQGWASPLPWRWTPDGLADFAFPAAAVALCAALAGGLVLGP